MKRSLLLGVLALAGLASRGEAQLAMQMTNGWTFTFSGNVNAFYIWNTTKAQPSGTTVGKNSGIGTGLLPAFATFEAKGKEGNTDLSAFFGFAPQVSAGDGLASFFGTDAAGAQIDMRQVYMTAGGKWGQVLAGKQLGLYQRSNIVEDMTIYGVGPGGGNRGTSLGRIAYGYEYTDFRPQFTYSSPSGKKFSWAAGIFSPLAYGVYTTLEAPRLEADANWKSTNGKFYIDLSGFVENVKDGVTGTTNNITPVGGAGTVKITLGTLALVGSGYYSSVGCSVFMGNSIAGGAAAPCDGISNNADASGKFNERSGYGWYGQATFSPKGGKWIFGGSYGGNWLQSNTEDDAAAQVMFDHRYAIIGQITYKATKSFRIVGEYDYFASYNQTAGVSGTTKTSDTNQIALGTMLFF